MSHKRTKKKKIISTAVLATSFYSSILFSIGMLLGYLAMRFFYKRYVEKGPFQFIYINLRGWEIHLHHWIFGFLIAIFLLIGGMGPEMPKFLWGIIIGIAVHDIYDFNDWHKVAVKQSRM